MFLSNKKITFVHLKYNTDSKIKMVHLYNISIHDRDTFQYDW